MMRHEVEKQYFLFFRTFIFDTSLKLFDRFDIFFFEKKLEKFKAKLIIIKKKQ